jgi:hypothetical protein
VPVVVAAALCTHRTSDLMLASLEQMDLAVAEEVDLLVMMDLMTE